MVYGGHDERIPVPLWKAMGMILSSGVRDQWAMCYQLQMDTNWAHHLLVNARPDQKFE